MKPLVIILALLASLTLGACQLTYVDSYTLVEGSAASAGGGAAHLTAEEAWTKQQRLIHRRWGWHPDDVVRHTHLNPPCNRRSDSAISCWWHTTRPESAQSGQYYGFYCLSDKDRTENLGFFTRTQCDRFKQTNPYAANALQVTRAKVQRACPALSPRSRHLSRECRTLMSRVRR